jgi:hypothetical protein
MGRLGGGVSYSALVLARLGLRVRALIGADAEASGADELQQLIEAGVDLIVAPLERGPVFVNVETPDGRVRARARLNDTLQPNVVCGQHGWWQPCPDVAAPGYEPFGPAGANFNLLIGNGAIDPISGSVPHRAYLCEVRAAEHPGDR